TICKFRTFTVTESVPPPEVLASGEQVTGPFPKLKNDPRTTAFGRVLRRTSIDELPQLLNVLWGTMSLVGPRPLAPDFAWNFRPWALRRYDVKPGVTGLWQVSGRNDLTYTEMCRLDQLYVTSWSIGLDVQILVRTARAVVSGRGCY
ncbi:MAG: sugar transferase, partial [Acidimicrobiales bacterium]